MRFGRNIAGSVLAAAIIAFPTAAAAAGAQQEIVISVPGIPGPYCAYGVEKRLLELAVIERVRLLWEEEEIRATLKPGGTLSEAELTSLMASADYPYDYKVGVK